jgi:hypothetical protein
MDGHPRRWRNRCNRIFTRNFGALKTAAAKAYGCLIRIQYWWLRIR